jgi:hypothetical protein
MVQVVGKRVKARLAREPLTKRAATMPGQRNWFETVSTASIAFSPSDKATPIQRVQRPIQRVERPRLEHDGVDQPEAAKADQRGMKHLVVGDQARTERAHEASGGQGFGRPLDPVRPAIFGDHVQTREVVRVGDRHHTSLSRLGVHSRRPDPEWSRSLR